MAGNVLPIRGCAPPAGPAPPPGAWAALSALLSGWVAGRGLASRGSAGPWVAGGRRHSQGSSPALGLLCCPPSCQPSFHLLKCKSDSVILLPAALPCSHGSWGEGQTPQQNVQRPLGLRFPPELRGPWDPAAPVPFPALGGRWRLPVPSQEEPPPHGLSLSPSFLLLGVRNSLFLTLWPPPPRTPCPWASPAWALATLVRGARPDFCPLGAQHLGRWVLGREGTYSSPTELSLAERQTHKQMKYPLMLCTQCLPPSVPGTRQTCRKS